MSWVVLKFGGTSVSTRERWETIAAVLRERLDEGLRPLVVCSALSGISNALERLLADALDGDPAEAVAAIAARHRSMADSLGVPFEPIESLLDEIGRLALGASLIGEVSPRLHARIMSAGELLSTRLGAAWLCAQGIPTGWVDARQCLEAEDPAEGAPDRASILYATVHYRQDPALIRTLEEQPEPVLLTQGFIARDAQGTVLLGRGGSDISASLFAARLGASRCEIWTDVPGMFSANPHAIPSARLLRALDYDEAQEIAGTGAKVLHPRCLAPLRHHSIPLHIRWTDRPELPGTVISVDAAVGGAQVKAISARTGITLVTMETVGMWQRVGFLADVFACFKRRALSVDLVSTSETNVTISLDPTSNSLEPARVSAVLRDLSPLCRARVIGPCGAVSLVGRDIRAILPQLAPALEVFEEQQIHLVTQAASDLNLTFVVDEGQTERLVQRLHAMLFDVRHTDALLGPSWEELSSPDPVAPPLIRDTWWHARAPALLELAADHTPIYVYDEPSLREAAGAVLGIASVDRVFYAIKANANPGVLRLLHDAGLGFECVSPGEVDHVFRLFPDLDPERVLFTPNFAPRWEYERGFERGVWVTLDNLHPLCAWPVVFAGRDILVRLDPGHGRGHHAYVKTAGANSKFGVATDEVEELERLVQAVGARVVGLHAHSGSGVRTPGSWAETAMFLASVAQRFPDVRMLDVGGGLGVPEKPGHARLDLGEVGALLASFREVHPEYELWMEPGRYLVATAGVLLARVTQTKTKGEIQYVGVDAGMNSLIRPALYGSHHEIVNLSRLDEPRTLVANVVGPICESGDTFGYARRLAAGTSEGDILLIATAGAYGRSMASNYNLREPAAEKLIP